MTLIIVTISEDLHTLILGLFMLQVSYNLITLESHIFTDVALFIFERYAVYFHFW